jgi:transcription antitermination factor NusG
MNVGEALSLPGINVRLGIQSLDFPAFLFSFPSIAISKMIPSKINWYTIYTYPNQEKKIYTTLLSKNIESYLPLQRVLRQWIDRVKELYMPLFPNYLFVHIGNSERGNVLGISGVARILSFDGKPAIIPDKEIQTIRQLENTKVEVEPTLVNGDRVQIIQGPFAGLEGILFDKKGKERFGVRLTRFRQSLSLEISRTFLKKI